MRAIKYLKFIRIVFLVFLSISAAESSDFFVETKTNISTSEINDLKKMMNVQYVQSVPSLGKNIQVWRTDKKPEDVQKILSSSKIVTIHSKINSDYRNFFADLEPGMDLLPEVSTRLAQIKARPTSGEVRAVIVRPAELTTRMLVNGFDQADGFSLPGTLKLNLSSDANIAVTRQLITRHDSANMEWSGFVWPKGDTAPTPENNNGTATLSVNNGDVIGRISVGNDIYSITPLGHGFHAIVKLNSAKFPPEHPPSQKTMEEKKSSKADRLQGAQPDSTLTPSNEMLNDSLAVPIIKIGVLYTSAAANKIGASTPEAFADALINITNVSYGKSKVKAKLQLAGVKVIDFLESGWDNDLDLLMSASIPSLAFLPDWRKSNNANLVVMITTLSDSCGKSASILASYKDGFALVNVGCALDNLSFPHEVGHLQGARHDEANDPTSEPFPYGHGYRYKTMWRTIMAYNCDENCQRLDYWANPTVLLNGVPMGTQSINYDAQVLSETAATMSKLKP